MPLLTVADQMPWEGFSVNNLLILIVILAILLPLMRWIRRRVSESRRERWAQEDDAETRYTEENAGITPRADPLPGGGAGPPRRSSRTSTGRW